MITYQFQVCGQVQGVGYRYYVWRRARSLGLTGLVQNRPDGSVLVIAQGESDLLEQLEELLRTGPPHSRVDEVRKDEIPVQSNFHEFRIEV